MLIDATNLAIINHLKDGRASFKKIAEDRYFFYARIKSGTAVFDPLFPYYLNGKGLKRFVFSRFGKLS